MVAFTLYFTLHSVSEWSTNEVNSESDGSGLVQEALNNTTSWLFALVVLNTETRVQVRSTSASRNVNCE